tara:strand:+ start:91 stop:366 length:276 start_codon:yes stop_codon:yes gene_type:complete
VNNTIDSLVMRCRTLEADHDPDGWPAIQMRDVSQLCDALDVPCWKNGEPENIRADVADALEWLKTIKPPDAENQCRLERCIASMNRWVVDA